MDHQTYLKLKKVLIQQRREVATSPEAAERLIDKLGIRDILPYINTSFAPKYASEKTSRRKSQTK